MIARATAQFTINARDRIGEGPAWDAAGGRLLWSDNELGIIHEARSDGAGGWCETKRWELGRPIAAAIPRAAGGMVVAGGVDVFFLSEAGASTAFVRIDADPAIVRLNEAKCDARGRLWAGTIVADFTAGLGALYRIDPDGAVTTVLRGVTISNGLDWSPDGRTFYYIDSLTLAVAAFDFNMTRGTLGERRDVVKVPRGEGGPDGMAIDREGCLWVAVVGAGEVRRYSPAGKLLSCVAIGTAGATSCAFGGSDGGELFITSLGRRMPDIALSLGFTDAMMDNSGPQAGGLFVCRPGATGAPAAPFAG